MKGLAEVLLDAQWQLTGSDLAADLRVAADLAERGMTIFNRHDAEFVSSDLDLLIYSAAIPEANPERQRAEQLGIQTLSYAEAIGDLTSSLQVVAVCGTHGKSSTTSILTALLESQLRAPMFFCGATRCSDGRNGKLGQELAIVEACEFRKHFLMFRPQFICLLGIEPDHFDCFPDFEMMLDAYRELLAQVEHAGSLIYRRDCEHSHRLAQEFSGKAVSFSVRDPAADWRLTPREIDFELHHNRKFIGRFATNLPGRHNLENCLAALATMGELGENLSSPTIDQALRNLPRLSRRFEIHEANESRIVIDDYAHHPTEIAATIQTARELFPERILRCWFQPHQLSRTQSLRSEFVASLMGADEVGILPVFGAREVASDEFVEESRNLVNLLVQAGVRAMSISSLDQVRRTLETDSTIPEILLTLGAGDITRIHHERTR